MLFSKTVLSMSLFSILAISPTSFAQTSQPKSTRLVDFRLNMGGAYARQSSVGTGLGATADIEIGNSVDHLDENAALGFGVKSKAFVTGKESNPTLPIVGVSPYVYVGLQSHDEKGAAEKPIGGGRALFVFGYDYEKNEALKRAWDHAGKIGFNGQIGGIAARASGSAEYSTFLKGGAGNYDGKVLPYIGSEEFLKLNGCIGVDANAKNNICLELQSVLQLAILQAAVSGKADLSYQHRIAGVNDLKSTKVIIKVGPYAQGEALANLGTVSSAGQIGFGAAILTK